MIWKRIDGISMRKLNKSLKKLAFSRMELEKQMQKELIVVLLEPKKGKVPTAPEIQREIEQTVMTLGGFETLRLCALEDCQPRYKEKLTNTGVARWIEIPVRPSVTYEFDHKLSEKGKWVEAFN